jgi:hypothetical protein
MVQSSNVAFVWAIRETSPDVFTIPAPPLPFNLHVDDVGSVRVFNPIAGGTAYEAPSAADRAARRDSINAMMQEIGDDHIVIARVPAGRIRVSRRLVLIGGNLAAWGLLGGILALLGAV